MTKASCATFDWRATKAIGRFGFHTRATCHQYISKALSFVTKRTGTDTVDSICANDRIWITNFDDCAVGCGIVNKTQITGRDLRNVFHRQESLPSSTEGSSSITVASKGKSFQSENIRGKVSRWRSLVDGKRNNSRTIKRRILTTVCEHPTMQSVQYLPKRYNPGWSTIDTGLLRVATWLRRRSIPTQWPIRPIQRN